MSRQISVVHTEEDAVQLFYLIGRLGGCLFTNDARFSPEIHADAFSLKRYRYAPACTVEFSIIPLCGVFLSIWMRVITFNVQSFAFPAIGGNLQNR